MQDTFKEFGAVDTRTAANMLGVSKSFLEKLRVENPSQSPPTIRIGRCVRYPLHALIEWIEKKTEGPSRDRKSV